jgi:hypothetical protein
MNIKNEVDAGLKALAECGVAVPAKAYNYPETEIVEFYDGGMSISEIADLVIQLSLIV